ncbi:MAG: Cytoskeleton protein RodZ [Oceanospirillaceae bacterium UBA2001]|nr:MAG: Cytoskeleton protein RodZ [Oceanospirillaceae bacterium UBA2001]
MNDVELLGMQDQPELDGEVRGFPGHLLREAREERGYSQKEAARDLHLTSKVIDALEESNFDIISSSLFARGYIRSYARHLGLDGQALVAEFDAIYGVPNQNKKPMPGVHQLGQQSKPGDTWVKLISIIFVIGLVVASVLWWQHQNGGSMLQRLNNVTLSNTAADLVVESLGEDDNSSDMELLAANPSEVGATVSDDQAAATEAPVQTLDVAEIVAVKPIVTALSEAVSVSPEMSDVSDSSALNPEIIAVPAVAQTEESTGAADVAALGPNEALLMMAFDKDCWVEIKDGNGKMVLSDLYASGSTIEQVVTAPIEILLGRSSGVAQMTFNGEVIDLKPHTRKDIARLTLSK